MMYSLVQDLAVDGIPVRLACGGVGPLDPRVLQVAGQPGVRSRRRPRRPAERSCDGDHGGGEPHQLLSVEAPMSGR